MEGKIISKCSENIVPFTGAESCTLNEGKTVAILVTDSKALFPVDPTAFNDSLQGFVGALGTGRVYPITNIVENSPSGGEIATSEIGFGGPQPTGTSAYSETYRPNAGLCLFKQAAQFNKRKLRVFRIDDQNNIFGTIVKRGDTEYYAGFEATMYCNYIKATDNSTVGAPRIGVYYGVNYETEFKKAHAFGLDAVPEGLVGVELKKVNSGVSQVVSSCSGTDFTATYGTDLTLDAFINDSGNNPTSVLFDEETGFLTIAPAGKYRVANAIVLQGLGIYDIEGNGVFTDLI